MQFPRPMRNNGPVDCVVAREALSARLDGEREPVPSARVDEHLRGCRDCATWFDRAGMQALQFRGLSDVGLIASTKKPAEPQPSAPHAAWGWLRRHALGTALVVVGLAQVALAAAQAAGMQFGMVAAHHGAATGAHLLNESTAWSAALGIVTVAMAFYHRIAPGLACVLVTYSGLLAYFVVADALAGQVTMVRVASHLPVAVAAALAIVVCRTERRGDPSPDVRADPPSGTKDRRHLRAADDPAA